MASAGGRTRTVSGTKQGGVLNVLLMEKVHKEAELAFQREGFNVIRPPKGAYTPEELLEVLPKIHAIGIRSKTKLPAEALAVAEKLMVVGCFCIGTDTTALPVAAGMGVPVFNSPYANSRSVAELVIAEMVMLARQAGDRSKECHGSIWNKQSAGCFEIRGKTLGIIGYGHVGSQLSVLAEAMGVKVVFHDVVPKLAIGNATQCHSLEHLLGMSDFVSLHVPKLASTAMMMNAETIGMMKKGSYLLNLSRGNVVDVDALSTALKAGALAGAAVDVYPLEPAKYVEDFKTPLQGCPNTILTPHIGGSTEEAQAAIGREVSGKMINFLNAGNTTGAVNVPNVANGSNLKENQSRVCCFHKNVPGVLRDINAVISAGNISYQALATDEENGYLMVDIDSDVGGDVKDKLESVANTTRNWIIYQGPGYCGEEGEPAEGVVDPAAEQ